MTDDENTQGVQCISTITKDHQQVIQISKSKGNRTQWRN